MTITWRQSRILRYLSTIGGPVGYTDLPSNGSESIRSLAERGYVTVSVMLTERGIAAAKAAEAEGVR